MLRRALPLNPPTKDLSGLPRGVCLLALTGTDGVKHCVTANLANFRILDPAEVFVVESSLSALHFCVGKTS